MHSAVDVTVIDSRDEDLQEAVVLSLLLGGGFHVLDDVAEQIRKAEEAVAVGPAVEGEEEVSPR